MAPYLQRDKVDDGLPTLSWRAGALRRLLRRYHYDLVKVDPEFPITKPTKAVNVEILADREFQQSVVQTRDLTLLDTDRLANLWSLCALTDPSGAILEIGTFRGGGALHLSNSDPGRKVIVCDPFSAESFQHVEPELDRFEHGQFTGVSPESVVKLFRSRGRDYEVIVGYFPDSVRGRSLPAVSFVHLDVDVYEATREALRFLLGSPALMPRSLIVLDDYRRQARGVDQAVEEVVGGAGGWAALPLFPGQGLLIPVTWFAHGVPGAAIRPSHFSARRTTPDT